MQIEPLHLSHQSLLDVRLRQLNLPLSEYSFANLYLFRHIHRYELIEIDKRIFIKGITRDKFPFVMLTSHPADIPHSLLKDVLSPVDLLFPIPEQWLKVWEPEKVTSYFKEEDSDYLFTLLKLATYPGRHLDGKRNLVKQLVNHYEVRSEAISLQFKDLHVILDQWQAERKEDQQTDYFSCQAAINNFAQLNLHGRILYINQQPMGFTIGEWSSKDYFTLHFAKALRSIKGIYQYLFQDLAQSLKETCSWINLEQDLGISAIRYAKLSYQPDLLVKKWRVQLKFL